MKTPGVYIVEKNAFPNAVVEVATAVPAFIGHTQIARNGNTDLTGIPFRITSMAEFHSFFGFAPTLKFGLSTDTKLPEAVQSTTTTDEPKKTGDTPATETPESPGTTGNTEAPETPTEAENTDPAQAPKAADGDKSKENSGTLKADGNDENSKETIKLSLAQDSCKLTLPGTFYSLYYNLLLFYANGGGPCYIVSVGNFTQEYKAESFSNAILALKKEQEPTMLVIPESVNMTEADCYKVQQDMLSHCGYDMKNRFAIIDIFNGFKDENGTTVKNFRSNIGSNNLAFGATYYPWLNTSVLSEKDVSFRNIEDDNLDALKTLVMKEFIDRNAFATDALNDIKTKFDKLKSNTLSSDEREQFHALLFQVSQNYKSILKELRQRINLLPPGASMAGIYTMVDNTRGVWKAPANVSVNYVVSPAFPITHEMQEDLNVPLSGKSVNAIRTFTGEGIKIWGARTLDGNSLDWRYINVRRTMIFLEESVKNAARAYVFEPNDANTWLNMRSMIEGFLKSVWKRGGLAGATPEDAFSVHIGLGETMTPEDILNGILSITVLVAISRPAEFIEITFQQQMQKS